MRHRSLRNAIDQAGYNVVVSRLKYLFNKYQSYHPTNDILQSDYQWVEKYQERINNRKRIINQKGSAVWSLSKRREKRERQKRH